MAESRGEGGEGSSRKRSFTRHSIDDILGTKSTEGEAASPRSASTQDDMPSTSSRDSSSAPLEGEKSAKRPKKRFTYTRQQKEALELYFQSMGYPDTQARDQIAETVGVEPEKVQTWFQNRRAKCRKREAPLYRPVHSTGAPLQWYYTQQQAQYMLQLQQLQQGSLLIPTSSQTEEGPHPPPHSPPPSA